MSKSYSFVQVENFYWFNFEFFQKTQQLSQLVTQHCHNLQLQTHDYHILTT
jgi:hypothetical protein